MKDKLVLLIAGAMTAAILGAAGAYAQGPPATPQGPATPEAQTAMRLTPAELDQLLAPIALYPDDLLANILMAATYPLDVVEADRWVRDPHNASLTDNPLFTALEEQNWDPSVKSLVPFPRILRMMDDELDWTERLGEAFLADEAAVMDSVQQLRQRAQSAGRLVSFPEATVTAEEQVIAIEPSIPEVVYVPICDPSVVYGDWPYPAYPPDYFPGFSDGATVVGLGCRWISAPIVAPLWGWHHFYWRTHDIKIDRVRFAVLNGNRPPLGGEEWGHDLSHRHTVSDRDAGLRARFGGATLSPEADLGVLGHPTSSVPRTDTALPLGPTQNGERATTEIERAVTRRIPPAFEPFGRNAEMRLVPTISVPQVYTAPPHGPSLTTESATERVEPSMRTRVPPAFEPLGRGTDVRIQTELGGSRRTLAPPIEPKAGAHYMMPSGGEGGRGPF
jgi:hypothetical protein